MAKTKRGAKPRATTTRQPKSKGDEALKLDLIRIFSYTDNPDKMIRHASMAYDYIKGIKAPDQNLPGKVINAAVDEALPTTGIPESGPVQAGQSIDPLPPVHTHRSRFETDSITM